MCLFAPEAHAELAEGLSITMTAAEIEQLAAAADEGADIADQVRVLAQDLPEHDIEIIHEEVRDAAAADLAEGVLDPERGWPRSRIPCA